MCKAEEARPLDKDIQGFQQEMKEFIKYCQKIDINFNIVYENTILALHKEENLGSKSLQDESKTGKLLTYWKILLTFVTLIIVTCIYIHWDLICIHLGAIARIIMIQALPLYDWRPLKREQCLIKTNPRTADSFKEDYTYDCNYCDGISSVFKLRMTDEIAIEYFFDKQEELAEELKSYYDIDAPILFQTNLTDTATFNIDNVKSDYDYIGYEPCDVESNVPFKRYASVEEIFEKLENAPFYFVHWRNCNLHALKLFRKHFPRPNYLHVDFSPIQQSWLMMGKNYYSEYQQFKKLMFSERMVVIVQIEGHIRIRLTPLYNCFVYKKCNDVIVDLNMGDAMIISDQWEAEYSFEAEEGKNISQREHINLAIALEAN